MIADDEPTPPNLRGRFTTPRPPAPTPRPRASAQTLVAPPAAPQPDVDDERASDADVLRAGGSMAIATLFSRITGFLRTVLIGSALGPAVASAFNTANTLPNLITELVLGAVLTSLVVPVLVRAEKEDPDRGAAFIRRLLTLTFTLTLTVTIISVVAAPLLVRLALDADGQVNIQMSSAFAYLLLPQILFYALFAVFMAVLNTKGIFAPGAWAPVVNNVVTLTVLGFYLFLPSETKLTPTQHVTITDPHILLLGLGTTLGVIVQALIMVPYLRKAGIDLRPLWGIDERLKSFGGMAIAIVVYVAISQVGFMINNRIASEASAAAPTIYMQAWQLLQVPYGVIGVTLLTAVMPRLSRNAADGDDEAVVRDLTVATRMTMLALVPITMFFTVFGTLVSSALFNYAEFDNATATILGWTVSFSAFTLIPYAVVLLHLRVFYAREEVWTPTFIIAGITITKLTLASIAPAIATEPRLVVVLLGAANGFGFLAGAIIGHRLLSRSLGSLHFRSVVKTGLWGIWASLIGCAIAFQVDLLLARTILTDHSNPWFLIRAIIAGLIFLPITALILSRSRLPEVATVGAALGSQVGRIPVLGPLIVRVFSSTAAAPLADATTAPSTSSHTSSLPSAAHGSGASADIHAADVAGAVTSAAVSAGTEADTPNDTLGAAMPPLPASGIRPLRLVPGASILHGRYRLLQDHGGSPAARLWQARDKAPVTPGSDIRALTIINPVAVAKATGLPLREAKNEVLRRSGLLKGEDIPGVARVLRVIDHGSVVVIVSEWTEGAPLVRVAADSPDPMAAGMAVAGLADAAATTAELGTAAGIDHRARIRVSTSGEAVVAFPGALPSNTVATDARGVAVTLKLLLDEVDEEHVPRGLRTVQAELPAAGRDPQPAPALRAMAVRLRGLADTEMTVAAEPTPVPSARDRLSGTQAAAKNLVVAGALGFVTVALIAAVIVGLAGIIGGDRSDSPVSRDSLRDGAGSVAGRADAQVPISGVAEWLPRGVGGTSDNPEDASLAVDGDPLTAWQSDVYRSQLGPTSVKSGLGLILTLPQDTDLHVLTLRGLRPGTVLDIRTAQGMPAALEDTALVTTLTVPGPNQPSLADAGIVLNPDGSLTLTLPKSAATTDRDHLILWVTALPMPDPAAIGEVEVLGTWKGQPAPSATGTPSGAPIGTPAP